MIVQKESAEFASSHWRGKAESNSPGPLALFLLVEGGEWRGQRQDSSSVHPGGLGCSTALAAEWPCGFFLGTGVRQAPQRPRKVAPYFTYLGILIMLTPGWKITLEAFSFFRFLPGFPKHHTLPPLSGLSVTGLSVACAVKAKTPQSAPSGWFLLQVFPPLISQSFPCFLKAWWGCLWWGPRGHNLFWIILKGVQICIKLV